jgi:hypothetical protein
MVVAAVISAMAIISAMVVAAMPVTAVPRIVPRSIITIVRPGVSISRIAIIRIAVAVIRTRSVVSSRNPDPNPDVNSGIGVAGKAQRSQQRNDE